jgi:YfiH family protein
MARILAGFEAGMERVEEAARALGWPPQFPVFSMHQVHGSICVAAGEEGPEQPTADAALCLRPGRLLSVRTADCVPLLLWGPEGVSAVVHAGWRGCAAGVVEAAVGALRERGVEASELRAWMGPAACGDCYEVGPEVVDALGLAPGASPLLRAGRGDRWMVDLRAFVRHRLRAHGVTEEAVRSHPACTMHDAAWPSWRRDGSDAGRLFGLVGWLP